MGELVDEPTLLATTYRRDGTPVATAIWPIPHRDGKLAFWSAETAGKVKRLKRDPRISFQVCDHDGNVVEGAPVVTGTAEAVFDAPDYDDLIERVKRKYGEEAFQHAHDLAEQYFTMGRTYVVATLDD